MDSTWIVLRGSAKIIKIQECNRVLDVLFKDFFVKWHQISTGLKYFNQNKLLFFLI